MNNEHDGPHTNAMPAASADTTHKFNINSSANIAGSNGAQTYANFSSSSNAP